MPRAPFNVLVIPYQRREEDHEFAVLHRRDSPMIQFIAGGGEDDETPLEAAKREAFEEGGITQGAWTALDSVAQIPRTAFPSATWPDSIHVIPEYCFAVRIDGQDLELSEEHVLVEWLSYDDAHERLTWDSNRAALQELRELLTRTV